MAKGNVSGYSLKKADIPIVLGMQARGDRDHDIAAWFGVNQGRVAEAKEGRHGTAAVVPAEQLPPRGPPGVKGRRLRAAAGVVLTLLKSQGGPENLDAIARLENALNAYDANEA